MRLHSIQDNNKPSWTLELLHKRPFLDAIVLCKNEAVEKALIGPPLIDSNNDELITDSSVECSKEHEITHTPSRTNDEEINFLDNIASLNDNNTDNASNDTTACKK